ncbi:phosphate/phosphite/phosphonate ABC transporter substrate-binding protein [Falsibacillus pallidus]|uniref:phosphate/phosphite/phosphonate ABC transporter substrate-binding protein n=1 Tax=Falsibacillus pallidus TaxID=493781 RepID=UPI003D999014
MFKKLTLFGMSLGLAFGVLAGCGSDDKENGSGDSKKGYEPKELNVQFVPSQSAETLEAKAKPLEKLLSDKLGIPVHVSVSTDYNTVVEAMGSKKVDVGFLPPTTYVLAHEQGVADVLLQAQRFGVNDEDGTPTKDLVDFYKSMVIVKKDSDIKSIEDLKGKKMGWQNVTSSAGYVWPAVELKKAGLDPEKDVQGVTLKGHDTAVLAVLNGDVDAAATFQDARNIVKKDAPDVFDKTRVLFFTKPIPNDTISVRPDLTKEWKDKIADAFISLGKDEKGHQIISEIYSHEGYTKSKDSNFDIVREYEKEVEGQ